MQLRRADLEAVLEFVGDVAWCETDEAYSPELLGRLQQLVRCGSSVYREYVYRTQRPCLRIGFGSSGPFRWGSASTEPAELGPDNELFWRTIGPCPIVHHRARAGNLAAVRMSDVVTIRRYHESSIYREYFRPLGVDHMLDLGLPDRARRQRSLLFCRRIGERNFSERDRAVLELLRPHLHRLERDSELRRQLAEGLGGQRPDEREGGAYAGLTAREREIVELVAEGKTNAEIAVELSVAPSTVKKHLEHIYAKLGVGRRAAVARFARSAG